ncbi:OLC1v1020002C1 [Oldenlandia corymbosa var. corymbosa]|uniref:OLC1v1020002C1 n=1 Tax=Oldenlandia corymbosa var. corymbosa TaxID=529605 RepID=A0AAV1EFA2_OLDCO|nr:OLC1v1020002C1 [Oldenlandia corymbosa var. corymbosa]
MSGCTNFFRNIFSFDGILKSNRGFFSFDSLLVVQKKEPTTDEGMTSESDPQPGIVEGNADGSSTSSKIVVEKADDGLSSEISIHVGEAIDGPATRQSVSAVKRFLAFVLQPFPRPAAPGLKD